MKTTFNIIRFLILFLAIAVGIVLVLTSFLLTNFNNYIIQLLTVIILYLTLLAIIWYSWETRQLKIETRRMRKWAAADNSLLKKQNVTNIRPYLRLQTMDGENKLRLVNEGKGVAVNLKIKYKKNKEIIGNQSVTAMAAAPGSFTDIHRGSLSLDPSENCTVVIDYEDIEGRKYLVTLRPNLDFNDGFEIVSQEEEIQ